MPKIRISDLVTLGFCLVLSLGAVGCGDYESTLSDADRQLFSEVTSADVAGLDEDGFGQLLEKCNQLITGSAATTMSGEETEQVTAQIELMITRLEEEIASETNSAAKQKKGRQHYELKRAIGRGGA